MPTKGQAKALKLRRLQDTPRFASDTAYQVAVLLRYTALPQADQDWADVEATTNPDGGPTRRSRKLDIDAEYQARLEKNPDEKPPLIIKVSIAGSGYNGWKTQVDGAGKVLEWEREDDVEDQDEVVHYSRDKGSGPELMYAGPGGDSTARSAFGGASDTGSNSIAALVEQVPPMIDEAIHAGVDSGRYGQIVVLIRSHSRGAVAASRIATQVKESWENLTVELTQVDPVPGPMHMGENREIDLTAGDEGGPDETTLVYSVASGYTLGYSFTPQKVHGAKRIIVSQQNHSVGLQNGFIYNNELFKGSALNSLDSGVYIDRNKDGENSVPLERVDDVEVAKEKIQAAFKASSARARDIGRLDIINEIIGEALADYV